MNTITDVINAAVRYVQHNGCAPTLEDLNREGTDTERQFQDTLGIYGFELFGQELLDEAVREGYVVCDADRRIFSLPEVYRSAVTEAAYAVSYGLSFKDYINKRLNSGYAWSKGRLEHGIGRKGLRKRDSMGCSQILRR